jgi:hypothetical protein
MRLLKFGDTTINIERAIRIDDNGSYLTIDFVAVDNPTLPLNIRLEGAAAEALRQWLAINAEDLLDELRDTGDDLGEPQPYVSPRSSAT